MGSATTVSPVMNCGHGDYGYDRNSYYQRECANLQKGKIEEVIKEKLDLKKFCSTSNTIRVADLGCSIGPNTFIAMHDVVEAMKQKLQSQFSPSSKMSEFQVFFNDQPSNDFDTLFTSLPKERPYFAVGVRGSFHGRLYPESSVHFAFAAHVLNWLSKVPEELLDKKSTAWNKGRVHYTNAPKEMVDAYKR
ncbi:hypothetical protein SLEP1_g29791 [Rubroshorea leprosula]|uniref:S-adenosylmethionine-dependent methyltransferase n=1 Tax=Rubroshorea leprosula TaxID=152421 RepID=A0AAV5JY39_9ROSI|nr:hypothetical protein SLEP1_g29791 [Rubroshorea leprosula]